MSRKAVLLVITLALTTGGCFSPRITAPSVKVEGDPILEQRVDDLEKRVNALEREMNRLRP